MFKCLVLCRGMAILRLLTKIWNERLFRSGFKSDKKKFKNKTLIPKFNLKFKNQEDKEKQNFWENLQKNKMKNGLEHVCLESCFGCIEFCWC